MKCNMTREMSREMFFTFREMYPTFISRNVKNISRLKKYCLPFILNNLRQMDLGWVGMTQVVSEEVRTSRWTPGQRSSGTTGGTSGSTSMSLKLSDSFMKS